MYKTRIYYQDTDAGGVVYFANYLRLFEKSWLEYLLSNGISLPEWGEKGTFVKVKTPFLDLLRRLGYGDEVEVTTSLTELKNAQSKLMGLLILFGRIGDRVGLPIARAKTPNLPAKKAGTPVLGSPYPTTKASCQVLPRRA